VWSDSIYIMLNPYIYIYIYIYKPQYIGTGYGVNILSPSKLKHAALEASSVVDLSCGRNHTVLVSDDGLVFSWGSNMNGSLGRPCSAEGGGGSSTFSSIPTTISLLQSAFIIKARCGRYHNIALDIDGRVYTWGDNSEGQCGLNTNAEEVRPSLVDSLSNNALIENIFAGAYYSGALTSQGHLYMWGSGEEGVLCATSGVQVCDYKEVAPALCTSLSGIYVTNAVLGGSHTYIIARSRREGEKEGQYTWQVPRSNSVASSLIYKPFIQSSGVYV
jgi:alpha-tubulin suppressor-like RCC1 family protein